MDHMRLSHLGIKSCFIMIPISSTVSWFGFIPVLIFVSSRYGSRYLQSCLISPYTIINTLLHSFIHSSQPFMPLLADGLHNLVVWLNQETHHAGSGRLGGLASCHSGLTAWLCGRLYGVTFYP